MCDISIGLIRQQDSQEQYFYHDKCDKFDYLAAAGCGVLSGIIDIFLVGTPEQSRIQPWTDKQVDNAVMSFAKKCGWSPKPEKANNVASAIGFLENGNAKSDFNGFKVNYDQRHSGDVNKLFNMSTSNHHMKSLAHAPDILGLFFSILNQFTSTSSFLTDGKLITIATNTFELQGHDFISKLYSGIANWFGHIMSDLAGSSGKVNRGSGIVIPFYELFQLCDFGKFKVGEFQNTLAKVATKVFESGYDARFGLTMAIPVIVCDLSIKLIWSVRHYFIMKEPLKDCIPNQQHDDLRIMLIIGDAALCLIDGLDAGIRSGGNWVNVILRLNLIAWFRLLTLVFKEVCIRCGFTSDVQMQLDAYIRINAALDQCIECLKQIDIERYKKEIEQYTTMHATLKNVTSSDELTSILREALHKLGMTMSWENGYDDFDSFMNDGNARMVFK